MLPGGARAPTPNTLFTVAVRDEEFTGTFAGEEASVLAKPAESTSLLEPSHAAALSKYAVDANKPVRVHKQPGFVIIALLYVSTHRR
jgi:hypothetical protein